MISVAVSFSSYSFYCRNNSLVHNPHIRAKLAQLVLLIAGSGGSSHQSRGLLPTVSLSMFCTINIVIHLCFSTLIASVKCLLITVWPICT